MTLTEQLLDIVRRDLAAWTDDGLVDQDVRGDLEGYLALIQASHRGDLEAAYEALKHSVPAPIRGGPAPSTPPPGPLAAGEGRAGSPASHQGPTHGSPHVRVAGSVRPD